MVVGGRVGLEVWATEVCATHCAHTHTWKHASTHTHTHSTYSLMHTRAHIDTGAHAHNPTAQQLCTRRPAPTPLPQPPTLSMDRMCSRRLANISACVRERTASSREKMSACFSWPTWSSRAACSAWISRSGAGVKERGEDGGCIFEQGMVVV